MIQVARFSSSKTFLNFFRLIVVVLSVSFAASEGLARAGGGRSMGRSSGYSNYRRPATQPYRSQYDARPAQPSQTPSYQANPVQPARQSGGFMRGLAGGIAGGFLGSMLFGGLSHGASGWGGGGGAGGFGGGGFGLIELLLIGGIGYLIYRLYAQRKAAQSGQTYFRQAEPVMSTGLGSGLSGASRDNVVDFAPSASFRALAAPSIEEDEATDIFFRIQAAWMRRDLSSVRDLLSQEILEVMEKDIAELKAKRQLNRLENITVRKTEVTGSWLDNGEELCNVNFLANLLDYTVEEENGRVVSGSDTTPVKFAETWTFVRKEGTRNWKLAAIEQV